MGTMFSGKAVVDWQNSSGLKKGAHDPMLFFYTAAGSHADPKAPFTQCLAYSQDGGQTIQKYEHNPIIPHIAASTRDPAVIWDPDSEKWIMALYIGHDEAHGQSPHQYSLFCSTNLIKWAHLQDLFFPGMGECPEFFPIPLDGDTNHLKWIFWTADGHYFVGQFDGHKFTPKTELLKSTYSAVANDQSTGPNFIGGYAAQTWSDIPAKDGRRLLIAWLTGDIPDMPFNQQMTFPVELTLRTTESGPRLYSWPINEIKLLVQEQRILENINLSNSPTLLPTDGHDCLDILAEIDVNRGSDCELNLRGISLIYSPIKQELSCLNRNIPLNAVDGKITLRVLLDSASIEIFGADGLIYLPISIVPDSDNTTCTVRAVDGVGVVKRCQIAKLCKFHKIT
ncbi:MAG: glycoside hydrolase family 32 protein, partial [Chloroflexota bacterium]